MPKANPDSELAKHRNLILKERVKGFVALEAEQDSQLLHPEKKPEESSAPELAMHSETEGCDKEDAREASPSRQVQNRTTGPENNPSLPHFRPTCHPFLPTSNAEKQLARG